MKKIIALFMISLFMSSCASAPKPGRRHVPGKRGDRVEKSFKNDRNSKLPNTDLLPEKNSKRLKLRKTARSLIGKKGRYIRANGRKFNNDCSGMVNAVYSSLGIDLMSRAPRYKPGTNGVKIIYNSYKKKSWSDRKKLPRAGDLIFFNNTWDMNGNGKWDDPLTHVGMVTGIEKDGTIVYIHHASGGVQRYRMNLKYKGTHKVRGKKVNDYLRKRPRWDKNRKKYLSDKFFFRFADVLR